MEATQPTSNGSKVYGKAYRVIGSILLYVLSVVGMTLVLVAVQQSRVIGDSQWQMMLLGFLVFCAQNLVPRWALSWLNLDHLKDSPDPVIRRTLEMASRSGKDIRTLEIRRQEDITYPFDLQVEGSKVTVSRRMIRELTPEEFDFALAYSYSNRKNLDRFGIAYGVHLFGVGLMALIVATVTHKIQGLSPSSVLLAFIGVLALLVIADTLVVHLTWQKIQIQRFARALTITQNIDAARSYVGKRMLCLVANHDQNMGWTLGKRIEQVPGNLEKAIAISQISN